MNNMDSKCQDSLQSFDRVFIHIADSQNFLSLHAVQLATLRRFAGMQLGLYDGALNATVA